MVHLRCCVRCRKSCFLAWINGLRDACPWALVPRDDPDIIAVDGKTSRRSHDRRKGRNPLHLVSAWAARQRIVLGQQATEEKSNEITAIPLLLKHLDLKGALVTMDAMETQTDIARAIRDGGGDYCISLKKNWPAVHAEVEKLFTHPPDDVTFETHETVDLTARRIETRRHTVCHKVDWMTSDRHFPGEPVFPDLAMIGRIRNRGRAKWKDRARDTVLSVLARSASLTCACLQEHRYRRVRSPVRRGRRHVGLREPDRSAIASVPAARTTMARLALFAVAALPDPAPRGDLSQITLRGHGWRVDCLSRAGWGQDALRRSFEIFARRHRMPMRMHSACGVGMFLTTLA